MAAAGADADHRGIDRDRATRLDGPRRRTVDLVLLIAGSVVLAASMAAAASGSPSDLEIRVFRWANDLPDAIRPLVWPLMQFGTFITIPLLTLVAFAFRRWRLGIAMAVAGVGVYLLAKVVKGWVERGRPGALLDGVQMREVFGEGSLGFPSGHAAVAAALTVVVAAYLGHRWLAIGLALAAIVLFGRMYVGAHLPLDLVGGFALGVVAASATNLILGVPASPERAASSPDG
jgi:undecaprenyl-diphosphatase